MTDNRTVQERLRDAAVDEQRRVQVRNHHVSNIVRGNSRTQTGEVVAIEDGDGETTGAFVVATESTFKDAGTVTVWFAVNDGKRITTGWHQREMAILHLLSVRYGDGDQMGAGAQYAARVLGIKDNED